MEGSQWKTMQHLQEALAGYVESNVYGRHDFFQQALQQFSIKAQSLPRRKTCDTESAIPADRSICCIWFIYDDCAAKLDAGAQQLKLVTIGAFVAAATKYYRVLCGSLITATR